MYIHDANARAHWGHKKSLAYLELKLLVVSLHVNARN